MEEEEEEQEKEEEETVAKALHGQRFPVPRGGRKTDLCKPFFTIFVFVFIIVIVYSYPEQALTVSQSRRGSYSNFEKIFPSRDQNLQPSDL